MKNVIVFDLDGTLRDGAHRKHLVPTENLDRTESWNEFNLACGDDEPIADNIKLLHALHKTHFIVILSSCSEVAQRLTVDWLNLYRVPYHMLVMRPADDNRPDVEFKEAKLREIGLNSILCCFEDNARVAQHIRSLGLTCHVVRHYDKPGGHEE